MGPKTRGFQPRPAALEGRDTQGSFSHSWDIWEKVLVIMGQGRCRSTLITTNPGEAKEGFDLMKAAKG